MGHQASLLFSFLLALHLSLSGVISTTFTLINRCEYTVWPGIVSNPGFPLLPTTGFVLQTGESTTVTAPTSWGGRLWARTICSQDSAGKFSCVTGDCGSGKLECAGNSATPPVTLAEFTLNGAGGLDFYDVSTLDGFNMPILVSPQGGSGDNCSVTGCVVDLNGACPSELKVMSVDGKEHVACKSACEAFGSPQYCCSGAYESPDTCKPSFYSRFFKSACPRAHSYAYDDETSLFKCASADYFIAFCPSLSIRDDSDIDDDDSDDEGDGNSNYSGNDDDGRPFFNLEVTVLDKVDDSKDAHENPEASNSGSGDIEHHHNKEELEQEQEEKDVDNINEFEREFKFTLSASNDRRNANLSRFLLQAISSSRQSWYRWSLLPSVLNVQFGLILAVGSVVVLSSLNQRFFHLWGCQSQDARVAGGRLQRVGKMKKEM